MKEAARQYYEQGCNIVVLNGEKEPLIKWTKWQTERQTLEEFESLPWGRAELFAIVCGLKLKNDLYIGAIDVDVKNVSEEAVERGRQFEKILKITQTEQTPSHGKHYIYYSRKPVETDSRAHEFCGCEVLGEKKLCIMAPSKGYRKINDNTPTEIESLNQLFDTALKRIGFKKQRSRLPSNLKRPRKEIRPCIHEAIEKDHLEHMAKVAVIAEYQHSGKTPEEIEALFQEHRGYEPDKYDPEKTRYQVDFCLKKGYQRFGCTTLEDLGLCLGSENCKFRQQDTFGVFFNEKGVFQPVWFAKDLLRKFHFKTTRDDETIYVFDRDQGIYTPNGEVFIKEQMARELDEDTRQRYFADVVFYIQGVTYFDRIHNPLGKIAVTNGILDVRTKELTEYIPELFITTRLPVAFDKEAKCPKIQKFIEEVAGKEQTPIIQEGIGYCLRKEMLIHKAFMLIGEGANGKSTLLELIKKFLGSENISNASLQSLCFNRFAVAQLYEKLANICADLPDSALKQTGMFKMLTGNDTIMAEEKFKQPFSFKNYAKLFFSANKVPETLDDTTAYFRRWILVTCNNRFVGEKCNPNILNEITTPEELSGLLNYALEGLQRLLENGRFSTTENIEELRTQYIRKSNSAKAFIEERLVYENDPKAVIPVAELYQKYVLFCQKIQLPSMQKRFFTMNMQQHLPQAKRTTARVGAQKKAKKVWQYVGFVTDVTASILKHSTPYFSLPQTVTNDSNGSNIVTEREVKKNEKLSLNGDRLQRLQNSEETPTTCALCQKMLPEDLFDCTTWEGRMVHTLCYLTLIKGRRDQSYEED